MPVIGEERGCVYRFINDWLVPIIDEAGMCMYPIDDRLMSAINGVQVLSGWRERGTGYSHFEKACHDLPIIPNFAFWIFSLYKICTGLYHPRPSNQEPPNRQPQQPQVLEGQGWGGRLRSIQGVLSLSSHQESNEPTLET